MPKEKCIDGINIHMLVMALEILKIPFIPEIVAKHPRDYFGHGRVNFKLKNVDGTYTHPTIKTKKELFKAICENWTEVLEKYADILEKQKAEVERKKAEIEKAQAEAKGEEAEKKESDSKADKKKDKKKKRK